MLRRSPRERGAAGVELGLLVSGIAAVLVAGAFGLGGTLVDTFSCLGEQIAAQGAAGCGDAPTGGGGTPPGDGGSGGGTAPATTAPAPAGSPTATATDVPTDAATASPTASPTDPPSATVPAG